MKKSARWSSVSPKHATYTLRGSFSVSKSVSGAWVILESNKETLAKRTNISMHCYVAPREKENPKKENNKEKPEKAGPKINTDNYGGGKPVIRNSLHNIINSKNKML